MATKTKEDIQFFRTKVVVTVWLQSHRDHYPYMLTYADADIADSRLDRDIADLCVLEDLRAKCQDELDRDRHRTERRHGDFCYKPADRRAVIEPISLTGDTHHNEKHRLKLFLANVVSDEQETDFDKTMTFHERWVGHEHGHLEYKGGNEGNVMYHIAALHKKAKKHAAKLVSRKRLWQRTRQLKAAASVDQNIKK